MNNRANPASLASLQRFSRALLTDRFFRHNVILFAGSFLTAVLNYLYHPILSRLMPVEAFGEVQAVLSLMMQFGVVTGVFALVATNLVSNKDSSTDLLKTTQELQVLAFYVTLLISAGILFTSPLLKSLFHFESVWPFVILAATVLTGMQLAFYTAWFRGVHDFVTVSLLGNLQAAGKLVFAVLFVLLGWGAFGAVFAFFCTGVLAVLFGAWKAGGNFRLKVGAWPGLTPALKQELWYGLLVLFATSFVTFLSFADVLIIKSLFSPEEAGLYSGVATIARIILFLTGSVAAVLLPYVKLSAPRGANLRLLRNSFLLLVFLGGSTLAFFALFPTFTVGLMIGSRYAELAYLLPWLGLLLFLVSAINLLVMYFLALRRFFLIPVTILGTGALALLVFFSHASLLQVVQDFLVVAVAVLLVLGWFVFRPGQPVPPTVQS